jgi:hypothetical protein
MSKPSRKHGHDAQHVDPATDPATDPPTARLETEATYVCDSCGEEIVVPVDISAGAHQDYVEDCPICCRPMRLHIDIDTSGEARIAGEPE